MSISYKYLQIIEEISKQVDISLIKDIIVPQSDNKTEKTNFAAILLEDDTIGLVFINLNARIKKKFKRDDFTKYNGTKLIDLAKLILSNDLYEKSLGLGSINAISQSFFKKAGYSFDFTSDSLGLLNVKHTDIIGMVGFFPPLVKLIEEIGSKLIIIEKKEELVQKTKKWAVSLDPAELKDCNKVLITGTTIINETLDEILEYCSEAKHASIIGPTASLLPDPLFELGIDVIGGSYIVDNVFFVQAIKKDIRWSNSVKKYAIERKKYPGYEELLSKIIH
ncbi:MAG: Rossmann-like domain-containing protein [Promethearchaeota archaeon]